MTWLIALWSRISSSPMGMVALKYVGIAALVLMILFQTKQAGKRTAQIEALEKRIKANEEGRKIEREVSAMPDGAALDELRRDWHK